MIMAEPGLSAEIIRQPGRRNAKDDFESSPFGFNPENGTLFVAPWFSVRAIPQLSLKVYIN
jgi:hypothetical protein